MPCQQPPGVEIYGSAPQFNAKNFSHIFTHKAEYEVPGKLHLISYYTIIAGGSEVHCKTMHLLFIVNYCH